MTSKMTPAELNHAILAECKKTTDATSMADIDPLYAELLALAEHNEKNNKDKNSKSDVFNTKDEEDQAKKERIDQKAKQQEIIDTSQQQAQDQLEALKQALGSDYNITQANLEIVQDPETELYHLVAHGDLNLRSLISAEGLELPQKIGGYLYLGSLTSAEGLKLPQEIGGSLNFFNLPLEQKQKLKKQRPDLADKIS